MDTLLHCRDLTLSRASGFRLGPLSLELGTGVTCLVGPNGAGKSTLMRLLCGLDQPSSGSVEIADERGLGYLPQDPLLPPRATAAAFLEYVGWLQKIPGPTRAAAAEQALAMVGLSDKADSRIRALSGGMQRRVGIAQALVHDPQILLLDEPTVGLDPAQRVSLRGTIGALSGARTVLVSTHLVEDVRGLADRVIVLREGAVVFDGTVAELESLEDPRALGDTPLERAITALMGEAR